jgi:hypothetical protein
MPEEFLFAQRKFGVSPNQLLTQSSGQTGHPLPRHHVWISQAPMLTFERCDEFKSMASVEPSKIRTASSSRRKQKSISRDSPDESQTGINVRVFPALLQDRREVLTATSTSGNPNA